MVCIIHWRHLHWRLVAHSVVVLSHWLLLRAAQAIGDQLARALALGSQVVAVLVVLRIDPVVNV